MPNREEEARRLWLVALALLAGSAAIAGVAGLINAEFVAAGLAFLVCVSLVVVRRHLAQKWRGGNDG